MTEMINKTIDMMETIVDNQEMIRGMEKTGLENVWRRSLCSK